MAVTMTTMTARAQPVQGELAEGVRARRPICGANGPAVAAMATGTREVASKYSDRSCWRVANGAARRACDCAASASASSAGRMKRYHVTGTQDEPRRPTLHGAAKACDQRPPRIAVQRGRATGHPQAATTWTGACDADREGHPPLQAANVRRVIGR